MQQESKGAFIGKVAFVTGAANGMGRATAIAFAREGATVVLADIAEEKNVQSATEIESIGGKAVALHCNVADAESVRNVLAEVKSRFGRLDAAVNCAGVEQETRTTVDTPVEDWNRIIGVNLSGVFHCLKYEIPLMLEKDGGAIVNISSIAGLVGLPGIPAYVASKHGIVGLTQTAAIDYAKRNLRVNAVCPGLIDTDMAHRANPPELLPVLAALHPMGRMGNPEEVAATAVWLCSPAASFITGQAIATDGGFLAT